MNTLMRPCVVLAGLAVLCCTELTSAQDVTAQIWRELGSGSASGDGISKETLGDAGPPSAAIDQLIGQIYVAWESGNSEIYVRKYTGTEWVEVGVGAASGGGISKTPGKSRFPSVAIGPDRQPVVAWLDDTSGNWEVYLKKFSATANTWAGIAGSAEAAGLSKALGRIVSPDGVLPGVAVASNGQIYVVWGTNATEKHVIVSAVGIADWVTLGPSVDVPNAEYSSDPTDALTPEYRGASRPSLALTLDNVPAVAYITQSSTSSGDVHVRRWSNGAWQPFGTGAATNRGISGIGPHADAGYTLSAPRLVFSLGNLAHVGWLYSDQSAKLIHLRRLDGAAWVNAGPSLSVPLANTEGGFTLGFNLDNAPIVAWAEVLPVLSPIGNIEIYLSKLASTSTGGSVWQECGAGSASGTGVSNMPGDSAYPVLSFMRPSVLANMPVAGNTPVLAWLDGGDFTEPRAAQVYIRRAQPASTLVEFSQPSYSVAENAGQAIVTVLRRGVLSRETRVRYATDGGTATPSVDYTAVSGELVFAQGETMKTFAVAVKLDDAVEERETVGLVLLNPSSGSDLGTNRAATLGIFDSSPPPPPPAGRVQFRFDRYEVNEGGGRVRIEVVRVEGTAGEVGVRYETLPLIDIAPAAIPNVDYTPVSGTLTFADGVASRAFEVPILDDTLVEGNESLGLRLSSPTGGATLGAVAVLLTIVDNDKPTPTSTVQFNPAEYRVAENGGSVQLRVTRSGDTSTAASVGYFTPEASIAVVGVATPGADFEITSGTLNFAPGETEKRFSVGIKADSFAEGNETFTAGLRNPVGTTLGTPVTAHIVIEELPPPPQAGVLGFAVGGFQISEGAGHAIITVVRREGTAGEVSIHYETLPLIDTANASLVGAVGVAVPNVDYRPASGTLTFADGVASRTFEVPILEDSLVEPSELLGLRLSNPTGGATLGAANVLLTIVDNDKPTPTSTVQFNPAEYRVAENGSVQLRVTRSGDTSTAASVGYFTPEASIAVVGVATPGWDFAITSGTLNFAPRETEKSFSVVIKADGLAEGNETFTAGLRNPVGTTLGTPVTAHVVIEELPPPPQAGVLGFSVGEFRISEGDGQAIITVVRREGSSGEVAVKYATSAPPFSEHAATAGADYTAANGTLTFANGETTKTFTVPILEDAMVEGAEFLLLSLSEPTGGAKINLNADKASLIIGDNDQPPGQIQFALSEFRVREGAGTVTLIVSRREGGAGEVSVDFKTADGTAKADSDYTAASGTLTFAPGQLSRAITVPIAKDSAAEGLETFTLALSNPVGGATLGNPSTVTVGIVDAEPAGVIQFARTEYVASERAGTATITIVRSEGGEGEVSVDYATMDGTAKEGLDYAGATGTLTFAAGEKSKSFAVTILEDTEQEPPETFSVLLSAPTGGAVLGPRNMAKLIIADNDAAARLQFLVSDYRVREDNPIGSATISVIRRGGFGRTVRVKYATADGTATAGEDYTAASGMLEFGPGQLFKTFRVPVSRDTTAEGTENVLLSLSDPEGGAILGSPSTATLTIADPEARNGSVQFPSPQFYVNEAAGSATITVTRKGTVGEITVNYAAVAGTAAETEDFTPVSGTLTFAAGESRKTFTVPITLDSATETLETVLLELSAPTGGSLLGTPSRAILNIVQGRTEP